jgi:hypothetical protein
METEEKIKQYKNSVAESFGNLSLGIFAVSLIGSVQWATIVLIIFGVIFVLCGTYIILPHDLKQEWFLRNVATPKNMAKFKRLGWLIVLVMFGYSLMQTGIIWLQVIGILFAISAYVVFYISIWRLTDKGSRKLTDA